MSLIDGTQHDNPSAAARPDRRELRQVFGRFATGITVVTTGPDHPRGMTANSFASVSLDPPLALLCIQRDAAMHEAILQAGEFAVSVLSARQEGVARHFADRTRLRGAQEFDPFDVWSGPRTGAPLLTEAIAWLECRLACVHDGGDHSIFLGEVISLGRRQQDEDALLFFGGAFHRLELDKDGEREPAPAPAERSRAGTNVNGNTKGNGVRG